MPAGYLLIRYYSLGLCSVCALCVCVCRLLSPFGFVECWTMWIENWANIVAVIRIGNRFIFPVFILLALFIGTEFKWSHLWNCITKTNKTVDTRINQLNHSFTFCLHQMAFVIIIVFALKSDQSEKFIFIKPKSDAQTVITHKSSSYFRWVFFLLQTFCILCECLRLFNKENIFFICVSLSQMYLDPINGSNGITQNHYV